VASQRTSMVQAFGWFVYGALVTGCGSVSSSSPDASPSGGSDSGPGQVCTPNKALRCDGANLVSCNADGSAEASASCPLGCDMTGVRCFDVAPSNGLASYLDMTAGQPALSLGTTATINTDDGTIQVDGQPVVALSATVAQGAAPTIRVLVVKSLTAAKVTVTGKNALAIVSNGDIKIADTFAASASSNIPGAGGFNDGGCVGGVGGTVAGGAIGGNGGGGFGNPGAPGGTATNSNGIAAAGAGGAVTGNATLVPLRGGCNSGTEGASLFGGGGGAIQMVSRTKISISGVLAANGASASGGGSGGGILLEAPVIEITGNVVANGGAGAGGCFLPKAGEDGRLDAIPATGGLACDPTTGGNGGNGAAGTTFARAGASLNLAGISNIVFAGHGGGGAGRIRVNTPAGGLTASGVFSPNPSTGTLGTR